jgi:hypothetical protein
MMPREFTPIRAQDAPALGKTTAGALNKQDACISRALSRADAQIRTGDPFITSEVLYQLSYVGDGVRV